MNNMPEVVLKVCSLDELADSKHPLRVLVRKYVRNNKGYSLPKEHLRHEDLDLVQEAVNAGYDYSSLEKAINRELCEE